MRLGFAVKVVGRPELKSHDTRRWQSRPHLSISIGYLHAILDYLDEIDVRMYRMASNVVPYASPRAVPAAGQPRSRGARRHVDADEFADFLAVAEGLRFDTMLEAKQKDVALLRPRDELPARGVGPG